jgi:hypothetical protein
MPIAINAGIAFTAGVGGQDRVQITHVATVFCGDASYPGSASPADPEGMHALFSILDEQYNALTDGAGNEVRAYSVYDATDATLVYKTGYVANPWIHFCTVNPSTGVIIDADYTIPQNTNVRVVYGVRGTLKDLPYDHPDAFTRFRSLTGEDVPPSVVLQDGSRPMTGTLNLDAHGITGVYSIERDSSTGILRINSPIRNEPHTGVDPLISCRYTPTGTETGSGYHGGVEWLLSDRSYTGVSLVMAADPSVANAKPALMISVSAQGYAAASLLFSAEYNTLRPWAGPIDLGAWNRHWGDAYLKSIWGPVGPEDTLPVIVGSGLSSENDATSLNLVGPVSLYRSVGGSAPSLYMEYFAADAQPAGTQVLGTVSLCDWGRTNQAIMSLSGDPTDSALSTTVLSWTVVNGTFGTVGMTLSSGAGSTTKSLTPINHLGLGLGSFGTWWGACFLDQVRSRLVNLDNSRSLHLYDGADLVLLARGADFDFFSDFGNRLISASLSSVDPNPWIDDNFILVGSVDSTFSSAGESLFGRTTVMSLKTSTDPDAVALISGPILNRLAYNRISMTTCFALQFLPDVDSNPSYIFSMGLGSNTNIELSSTLFRVAMAHESRLLWLSWDDGQGHAAGTSTSQVLSAETYYTLEMRHGSDDLMRVYLNGANILVGVPGFTGDDPGVLFTPGNGEFYSCPACITSLSSGTSIPVIIDWIDIHSEGHAR